MLEFDSLCYLQNQKTGGTFVETFLRKFCTEGFWRYEKHRAPPVRREGKFYFMNVREPLDTYLSLFNYGLDGKGELLGRLHSAGLGHLYEQGLAGFADWLEAVLDARNAQLVYPAQATSLAPHLGLVSFRYLRLAAFGMEREAQNFTSREEILAFEEANRLVGAVIRYEHLKDDLIALVRGPLNHALGDMDAALHWLESAPKVNASKRRDQQADLAIPEELRARLREREWFLYSRFYSNDKAMQ